MSLRCLGMILISLVFSVLTVSCWFGVEQQTDEEVDLLVGPYMGQVPPGMVPEKFLADVLDHNFCSVFSPKGDEFYFSHYDPEANACSIEVMTMTDGVWSHPKVTSFSSDFIDNDVAMSGDGNRVIFRSNRPLPGDLTGEKRDNLYLWTSTRTADGWTDAEAVAFGERTDIAGGYPSLTSEDFLYFTTISEGDRGTKDIHRSSCADGVFGAPEKLGETVNSPYVEGDLFVAPDGSFLIVARSDHPENIGGGGLDLWVSFRTLEDRWTTPVNMGPDINTEHGENCPAVSPDNRFLFFNRYSGEEGNEVNGTYWVDARILDRFRPVADRRAQ